MNKETIHKEKEVLTNKLTHLIENRKKSVSDTIFDIQNDGNLLTDFLAPLGTHAGEVAVEFKSNGKLLCDFNGQSYSLHKHAIGQTGLKLGIPTKYIKDLATSSVQWQRDLSAEILNKHSLNTNRQRVLIRSVGDEIRGVLSDRYRRLSTPVIYNSFLKEVYNQGAVIIDAHYDETRSWIEVVSPQVVPIPTEKNGIHYTVFGLRIANSDFGDGALDVRGFQFNVLCTNGMVSKSIVREIHLGSRISNNVQMSERTYKLDTETQASAIKDIVTGELNLKAIENYTHKLQTASKKDVDLSNEIKRLPSLGMTKGEASAVEKVLINNRKEDGVEGEPTLLKFVNGVTAVARDTGGRRRREIEEFAGKLIDEVKA